MGEAKTKKGGGGELLTIFLIGGGIGAALAVIGHFEKKRRRAPAQRRQAPPGAFIPARTATGPQLPPTATAVEAGVVRLSDLDRMRALEESAQGLSGYGAPTVPLIGTPEPLTAPYSGGELDGLWGELK
jgi:hypothetical protein